jgi:signal transduction histidine kinase
MRALWIGVGFALISIASVALSEMLPLADLNQIDTLNLAWVRPASMVVVLAVLTQGLRTAPIDTRLRPLYLYLAAFGAVGILSVAFQTVPVFSQVWAGEQEPLPTRFTSFWAPAISATLWVTLATAYCLVGFRRSRHLLTYSGLLLYGLTLSELARAITFQDPNWTIVSSVMRAAAVSIGFLGVTTELRMVFARLSTRLFEVNVEHQTSQALQRAQQEAARERAHEARNALTAIEGATRTLERYRDRLEPESQTVLSQAVTTEIARLQLLVSDSEHERTQTVVYRLSDVIASQVALAQSRGLTVLADVPQELYAVGRPNETAEALQNLLTNAERHAPGSGVTVRAGLDEEHVTVRVQDRGPGVVRSKREAIFGREVRASEAEGSGLGLFLSSRLIAEQGGHLWYEDTPGGGACFAFRLPAHLEFPTEETATVADTTTTSAPSVFRS